jgi:multiple sugar transport system permease protein
MRPGWPQALMVLPTQALLVLVIGLPALWVFWLSLQKTSFGVDPEFVGLANYAFVLTDTYFWRAFLNTFVVVNVVVYLELALALLMAVMFAAGVPFRRTLIAAVLAPYAVSEVIAVIIWKYML